MGQLLDELVLQAGKEFPGLLCVGWHGGLWDFSGREGGRGVLVKGFLLVGQLGGQHFPLQAVEEFWDLQCVGCPGAV